MSVMRPELIMKSIIPVVMAGIIAIYGLVVAVLVGNGSEYNFITFHLVIFGSPVVIYRNDNMFFPGQFSFG